MLKKLTRKKTDNHLPCVVSRLKHSTRLMVSSWASKHTFRLPDIINSQINSLHGDRRKPFQWVWVMVQFLTWTAGAHYFQLEWRLFIKMATDWQVSEVGDTRTPAAGPGRGRAVQIEWISAWTAHLGFPALLSVPHLLAREIKMNRRNLTLSNPWPFFYILAVSSRTYMVNLSGREGKYHFHLLFWAVFFLPCPRKQRCCSTPFEWQTVKSDGDRWFLIIAMVFFIMPFQSIGSIFRWGLTGGW